MNSFGRIFHIHIFGESHGENLGVVIDGCPAGINLCAADFESDLSRRRSGMRGTTSRRETDAPSIVSGVYNEYTTGAPLAILFSNNDTRSSDYEQFRTMPRPGHADFVAAKKWDNFNDPRGGGHFSGRITLALTAAGVVAKKCIAPISVSAELTEAGGSGANIPETVNNAMSNRDSVGGIIECRAQHIPVGLGAPFFDTVESLLAHILFAIPAVKGVEFGAGFAAARMTGSQHNDVFITSDGKTATNHAGGINGGITNGNELFFRVAVKPTASIACPQQTINVQTNMIETLHVKGRHDACIALRAPVVVEAAAAIVLCDLTLRRKADVITNV
ncbi:MAG: chorismate synthase [Prevotellaceae bacterium]|jgi:chorismate synthase|nr:chorismate synthase [Prevotellaceae bacterium]